MAIKDHLMLKCQKDLGASCNQTTTFVNNGGSVDMKSIKCIYFICIQGFIDTGPDVAVSVNVIHYHKRKSLSFTVSTN